MYRVCIAVVDATRARLFTFDRAADEAGVHGQLVEEPELVNAARQASSVPVLATASGSPAGAHRHDALDEHRGHRAAHHDVEFARTALAARRQMVDQNTPQRVCAGPRMLGTLRERYAGILPERLPIEELGRDLISMSSSELRNELVAQGLLPPRPRARPIA